MRARVYWHGLFPDINMQGVLIARGTIRHEVLWDGRASNNTSLEWVACVKPVSEWKKCDCGRCGGAPGRRSARSRAHDLSGSATETHASVPEAGGSI